MLPAPQEPACEQYRQQMSELFAPFTRVAAKNPYAAAPVDRSAKELAPSQTATG